MKHVKKSGLIMGSIPVKFYEDVSARIDEFQLLGLEVEIQYMFSINMHSAFIIGRG